MKVFGKNMTMDIDIGVKVVNKLKAYQELIKVIPQELVLLDEPMKKHTSFKIGGPADIMVIPETIDQLKNAIKISKENQIPYFIIGNGSNLIVRDKGMRCIVIKIAEQFSKVSFHGNTVVAEAGILLSKLSKKIMAESLKGFEFASGIPGTLGGAITMNAGAYGGEMKDVVKGAHLLDGNGEIRYFTLGELELGYRSSIIQKQGYIALDVELELEKGDYQEILEITKDLTERRTTKQPLHLPSAGSVFKRPEGYFAGKLIQDSGLRGQRVGGAQVSELHSGFIVNVGDATAKDVLDLIQLIKDRVYETFHVQLETEVRIIGEE